MERQSQSRTCRNLAPLFGLWSIIVLTMAGAAYSQRAVINANQHRVDPSSCPASGSPEVPFPQLAESGHVRANSFHVNPDQYTFLKARCYDGHDRPRIYSDDAEFDGNTQQKSYIQSLCDDISVPDQPPSGKQPRGKEHYEHWEASLSYLSNRGQIGLGGYSTWPAAGPAREMIDWFEANVKAPHCAGMDDDPSETAANIVPLTPNGTLTRATSGRLTRLLWNGNPATLIGFGYMGALSAADRTLLVKPCVQQGCPDGLLGTLRDKGANLIRIWAIEQWSALAVCAVETSPLIASAEGLTPFSGYWGDKHYELSVDGLNPFFFQRLREFVQLAADRGIVVQLAVYDKHGTINRNCVAQWDGSPYNHLRNATQLPDLFLVGDPGTCGCSYAEVCQAGEMGGDEDQILTCSTLPGFLNHPLFTPIQEAYLKRVAQEVGGTGNMIFEIINEMSKDSDWTTNCVGGCNPSVATCLCDGERWQKDFVACTLDRELPVFTARDAFNEEADNQTLSSKVPDAGINTWSAQNAMIYSTTDPETNLRMGRVSGWGQQSFTRGALQLSTATPWSEIGVRATVSRLAGSMELGFSAGGNPTGNLIRLELGPTMTLGSTTRVAIVKRIGTQITELGATAMYVPAKSEIQLLVDPVAHLARLRINGVAIFENLATGTIPAGLSHAYFRGSKPYGTYGLTDGEIDNFEANVYYRDPTFICQAPLP